MLLDLVQNIALLLMLVVGLQVLTQRFEKRRVLFQVAAGILFGVVGVVGMMTPLRFDEGVIYDGRSIVLALSGVFVGWISTLTAAVICVAYRIYLGGAGALAGSLVVVEAAILGLYFRRLSQRNERWMNPLSLLGLGVLVHALMVLLQLFIPGELGMAAVSRIGLPVMLFYPPAFLLAASVFLEVERHRAGIDALARSEERYRTLFEKNQAIMSERLKLEEQYRHAQKMEAVGQLAGGLAHDFNNILQGILSYAQIMLDDEHTSGSAREGLLEIKRSAQRAGDLTRQLLTFSRRQIMQPKALDLNEVVEGIARMLTRLLGEQYRVEWIPGKGLHSVCADPGMVEQALMNLGINGRDAMPEGGTLTIETDNVQLDLDYCENHIWAKPGRFVLLSVTDTGQGMDEETRTHIFEPFFTTKAVGKGTGLGLATVYGIVQQHEGMIEVYSEPGHGTTFKIYFPEANPEGVAELGSTIQDVAVQGGSETILLAEDNALVRKLGQDVLQGVGYRVLSAADGQQACKLFEQHRDEIGLVILDVVMPQLSGPKILGRIREMAPDVPFLFTSGYGERTVKTQFVHDEGLHMLQKPYAPQRLLLLVRQLLDGAA
jgi:signal transduction histidine kinase/CheY-like chemotaxis protein